MDSITQAALGAAIGEAMLGKKLGKKGALYGAALATVPDLDVLLYAFYDKYEMLSIHRGFSHSILFSILAAFILTFILARLKTFSTIKPIIIFWFGWLCLFTHMLLDTFTSYGTQLFLPFSDRRVGFDSINVIDPVYTLPLLLGVALSAWVFRNHATRATYNRIGIILSSAYLLFTLVNKEVMNSKFSDELENAHIEYDSLTSIPVGMANYAWYGVATRKDSLYLIQQSLFGKTAEIERFPIHEEYLELLDSEVADKMRWFAKGIYTVDSVNNKIRIYNLQVDMRGVVMNSDTRAPTAGYFEIPIGGGKDEFSSGSHSYD